VSRQAHPGEAIVLLGIGFGAVTPDAPAGRIVSGLTQLVAPIAFSFGQTPVTPAYAGLMPSSGAVGLYQFNLVAPSIPMTMPSPSPLRWAERRELRRCLPR